ncbi:MAG: DUF4252 domain-containing protein [Lacipirellulaceae bacterium]
MLVAKEVSGVRAARRKPAGSTPVTVALLVALFGSAAATANAQEETITGRIEFDHAAIPNAEAAFEVDLGKGMLTDVSGLFGAALDGIVEGLLESVKGQESQAITQSAEYLKSVQEIINQVGGAVSEVRIRGYDRLTEEDSGKRSALIAHYQKRIKEANWDDLVRVRERNATAIVSALREDGAIRGLFVIGSEGNNLVLVNVVCDLSPEKVKIVSKNIAQLSMKLGLKQELEKVMREIQRDMH